VANADKVLQDTDADYKQRTEMMIILANHIEERLEASPSPSEVAIMIIKEPIFVRKQQLLDQWIRSLNLFPEPIIEFTWVLGLDTLERLFTRRYYDNDDDTMHRSLRSFLREPDAYNAGGQVLCASRDGKKVDIDVCGGRKGQNGRYRRGRGESE
jgi:nicotinamide-nucleotide adenylyltransferase